jgi:hypothetical protein
MPLIISLVAPASRLPLRARPISAIHHLIHRPGVLNPHLPSQGPTRSTQTALLSRKYGNLINWYLFEFAAREVKLSEETTGLAVTYTFDPAASDADVGELPCMKPTVLRVEELRRETVTCRQAGGWT